MKANDILAIVGNTPHIRINKLFGPDRNYDTGERCLSIEGFLPA